MDFSDLFGEPSYSEILASVQFLEKEVENLDQDSLVDEISGIQHKIVGDESEKIQHLIFKAFADADLTDEEIAFLKRVYVLYYCQYAYNLDWEEDEDEV
jgi:hypothetical protein